MSVKGVGMVVAAKLSAETAEAKRVFESIVAEIKAANAGIPAEEIQAAVDEAIREVRAERRKKMTATAART